MHNNLSFGQCCKCWTVKRDDSLKEVRLNEKFDKSGQEWYIRYDRGYICENCLEDENK